MKRIALITAKPSTISGVTVFMRTLQEELAKEGFKAELVPPVETVLSGVQQMGYVLGYALLKDRLSKFDIILGNSVGLTGAADLDVKIVYNAHANSIAGNMAMRASFDQISATERHYLNKIQSRINDSGWRDVGEALSGNRVIFEMDRALAKRADMLIAVAPGVAQNFSSHYGVPKRKIRTVMNGIESRWWQPRTIDARIASAPVNVVFTGRGSDSPSVIFHKGLDRVLALGAQLKGVPFTAILSCASGGKQDEYRALMGEHGIRTLFDVPNAELPHYLRAGDIYVHPSRTEACSLAILEAMASGLAPVAYPIGAVPDFMEDGVNGYIVTTVDEMRARVALLAGDRELRERMGHEAAATVRKHFTVPRMVKGYVQALDKL